MKVTNKKDSYYQKRFIIPDNCYTVKSLVKLDKCPVKLGVLKNIIEFTGLTPTYEAKLDNGTVRKYYDKDICFAVCQAFLNEHPDTKSFFIKYKSSLKSAEEKLSARQKASKTMLARYGYDNPSKSEDIQLKKKANFIENHGVSFSEYMSIVSYNSKDKREATNIERYGQDYAKKFAEKSKQTIISVYGTDGYKEIYKKSQNTLLERYGVNNPAQIATSKEKARKTIEANKVNLINEIHAAGGIAFQEIYEKLGIYTTAIYDQVSNNGITTLYKNKKPYILLEDYLKIEPELRRISELDRHSNISAKEDSFMEFLRSIYLGPIIRNSRSIISPQELDFYLPDKNLAIEFNGLFWHSDIKKEKNYHSNKAKKCEELGIRLIHIYENEWDNLKQREKIKSLIKAALGLFENKIYARTCKIQKLTNTEAKNFNDCNHLQNHRNAQVTYGLFYKNNLVQIMSFSKTTYNYYTRKYNAWEIIRSCTLLNTLVIGGVSKLYKHFINEFNPAAVFSYCDFNKFTGIGYEKLNMQFIGYTEPDFKWIIRSGKYGYALTNRNPTKHKELQQLAEGKLWGAGSKKYLIKYYDEQPDVNI